MLSPSSLMFALAANDLRICFAFNVSTKESIYFNQAFENFFNISSEQATVTMLQEMVHDEDKNFLKQVFAEIQPGDFRNNIEFRMLLPDTKEYWVKLSLYFDRIHNEQVISGYLEDISAAKAHNNKLNEFANKKNAILNILAHDLAGPLGTIQMFSQYLAKKTQDLEDPLVKKSISNIEQISKQSVEMIQEFLKVEFMESAGVEMVKQRTDIVKSFQSLMGEYQRSENQMKISFEFLSSAPNMFAQVDESKLVQAVNNLISNSTKFTPDGGTISLLVEKRNETILITLKDTGIGIPQKHHDTLFNKFSSARRTGLKGEPSVGLGMSIIKTIIEWHNGIIWFESTEHLGTTFYIELQV